MGDRSVPRGKYCRSSRFVFSFVQRCQGLCGSQKYTRTRCQFLNAQGINYSLSALYHLLASGKISPRRAGTLAYISSLLLHSLGAINTDRHPNAGAEDPNEKPASVYQSEAQWALAAFTPPIVPPPTDSRLQSNPVPATQQAPVPVESQENITMHHLDHAPCTAASSLC